MKYKTITLLFLFVSLITFGMFVFAPDNASAAQMPVCNDGETLFPIAFRGDPNEFCADNGGYSNRNVSVCNDGSTIVPPLYRGDVTVFCAPYGGIDLGLDTEEPDDVPIQLGEKGCEADVLTQENCSIIQYLVIGINFLSAVAGMAIVASIMIAGYQYMTARDNPGTIQKSKIRIVWALIALFIFIFMYTILNFLVPGGVL